jgi:ABC-type multidrug transport system fused ATPase/permease subunit
MGAVLDAPVEPPRTVGTTIDAAPEVALEQVEFRYPGAPAPTLRDVTHVFPAGRISAIIGRSGSGKSSLFGLIDGLRMPDRGVVRIAGQSVAALGEAGLRETVAVVSQTPLLIADTVRANFQLARADATDAQIEAAARTAGLWPALLKLGGDRVLDIPISPTPGQGLSGGERKLLAVARVLLCQPRVLLLDEPTTGVDLVSIGTLLDALRTACSGMTVIMIEHNLDFVRGLADEVCCLVDGRFADIGSPAELAARPSLFRDLLAARERLVDTTSLQLRSVRLPSLSGGDAADPWAPPAVDGPAGEPPRITLLRKP